MNASKKTLIFITPSFSKGGAEKNMLNIINSLDTPIFNIHLIICTDILSTYSRLLNKKIFIHYLTKSSIKQSLIHCLKLIRDIKPDIVFTSALHLSIPIILYKKIFSPDFLKVTRIPSLPSNNLGTKKTKIINVITKYTLRWSNWIVAQSEEMKQEINKHYHINDLSKIIIIPNLVDNKTIISKSIERVDLPKDSFYYIAAGSLYSVKGFDLLIKAFSQLVEKYPISKLIIIGEESVEKGYRGYLEKLITNKELSEHVFLLGHQDNPYKFYRFADAFVLSSIKEGFPNVVLENIVLNKPVLVTNCVDWGNIISSSNGIVIEKESINELVKGLTSIRKIKPTQVSLPNFDFNYWLNNI